MLQVLGKSCFKAQKNPQDKYFYCWKVHFCIFCVLSSLGLLGKICYKVQIFPLVEYFHTWNEYFESLEIFWVEYWTGDNMPNHWVAFVKRNVYCEYWPLPADIIRNLPKYDLNCKSRHEIFFLLCSYMSFKLGW